MTILFLGREAKQVLENENAILVVPTIVLAELKYLSVRRRLSLTFSDMLELIQKDRRMVIHPVDMDVITAMPDDLDIHDALICGTALVHQDMGEEVALLTKDERIRSSGHIPIIW
jgi:hypothetical protein